MAARERGVVGVVVLGILAVVMAVFVAAYALSRMTGGGGDRDTTMDRLLAAQRKLDEFAAAQRRLPCPADPTLDTGDEGLTAPNAATCTANAQAGTLPWKALGMNRVDSFDAWGRKISYRVYQGNNGSLVQPGAIDMTQCDTVEPSVGNTTAKAGGAGGLCVANADPLLRSTSVANFLAGKELQLTEMGAVRANVAYVVLSHGPSGLGGWSASNVQLPQPSGQDERDHLNAAGPFVIRQVSTPEVQEKAAGLKGDFDDLLVYRTLPDLVKLAGLEARDWPESPPPPPPPLPPPASGETVFTAAAVAAAGGNTSGPGGDTNRDTLTFGSALEVRGFLADVSTLSNIQNQNLSYATTTVTDGRQIGGLGIPNAQAGLSSDPVGTQTEIMRFRILSGFTRNIGLTLTQFGTSPATGDEQVRIYFLNGNTILGSVDRPACTPFGGSFSLSFNQDFDFVGLQALPTTTSQVSAFFIASFRTCATSPCVPSLATIPDLALCP